MLFGRVLTDGRLNARVKCDLTEDLALKANAQVNFMFVLLIKKKHVLISFIFELPHPSSLWGEENSCLCI